MPRHLRAVAAAALALVLTPLHGLMAPASAAGPALARWTSISGTSGYVDVQLRHFAPIDLPFNDQTRPGYMRISGDPTAAVVIASMAAARGDSAAPWIPIIKLRLPGSQKVVYWHDSVAGLRPGDYRLYLIAKRPTTVTFFLPGQPAGRSTLRATTATHSASSVVADAPDNLTGLAVKRHENSLFFTVRHHDLAFGVEWVHGPDQPLFRTGLSCGYPDDPVGGRVLPGCPGAFVTFDYEAFPFTDADTLSGFAVQDQAGRVGVSIQETVVGSGIGITSALYNLEA